MTTATGNTEKVHHGRNIKRFREMLGIKQEALALELGEDWNQKKVSLLESKEMVDPALLEQVAKILKIPTEAIKNLDEESAINIISNTFQDFKDHAIANANHCTFNPLDELLKSLEDNKKLYERLLQSEREKVELLQKMLNKKGITD